jgi:hypothetical protein
MTELETNQPTCFGTLDIVFPLGDDGLRHTPPVCLNCSEKTPCLREAVQSKKGGLIREKFIEPADQSGLFRFFERWSRTKTLNQK